MDNKDKDAAPTKNMLKLRHKMIYDISTRLEQFSLNTVIFRIYGNIPTSSLIWPRKMAALIRKRWKLQPSLLHHLHRTLARNCWEQLGHENSVFDNQWPSADEEAMKDDEVNVAVQINGKVRAVIQLPADISKEDTVERCVAGKEAVAAKLTGNIVKEIYVPGKIINIVMK